MRPSMGKHSRRSSRGSIRSMRRSRLNELREVESVLDKPAKCTCTHCKIMSRVSMDRATPLMQRRIRQVLTAIDGKTDKIFQELDDFVALKTISSDLDYVPECLIAIGKVHDRLKKMKFTVNDYLVNVNSSECGSDPSQKVLFGHYFSSPTKNTLLIYAYLDVHKAAVEDGWLGDPFDLTTNNGYLYGRGVSTGKGMAVCWLNAIECWLNELGDLPINIKIIVESLHEMGSTGLEQYIKTKMDFFLDVDWMVFGNNSWLNDKAPVLSCTLAGWANFGVRARGANKHLEGGLAGGLVYEPMTDVCQFMNSLVNNQQELQITKINDMVRPIAHHEWDLLESSDFSEYDYKEKLGLRRLRYELSKAELLEHRWCHTNVTMHGIEGCFSGPGSSTIMPMSVMGKFTIKLIPDQDVSHVQAFVDEYLQFQRAEHNMGTDIRIDLIDSCEPYIWSFDNRYTKAAVSAVDRVYQEEPMLTSSIVTCMPIASVFRRLLGIPIILLPYTTRTDSSQTVNESIPAQRFIYFLKSCASLMHELSMLPVKCKCEAIYEYCNRRGLAEIMESARQTTEPVVLPKKGILVNLDDRNLSYDYSSEEEEEAKETKRSLIKFLSLAFRRRKPKRSRSIDHFQH